MQMLNRARAVIRKYGDNNPKNILGQYRTEK